MPYVPQDVLDEIHQMKNQLREIQGRLNIRPAQNQVTGGDVTVGDGGTFKVNNLSGGPAFYVGGIGPAHPDGSPQRGLLAYREDGTLAISVSTVTADPQTFILRDRTGNWLVSENATGLLATPYISAGGWTGETEQPAVFTTSTSFTNIMYMPFIKQHPNVRAHYLVRASDASTSGEIRLVDGSGTQIGPTINVPLGTFTFDYIEGAIAGSHLSQTYLHWQARVTAGPGTIGVKGLATWGIKS